MIITKQKSTKQILEYLKDAKSIFLVGCAQCATVCKTGGEEDLLRMRKVLEAEGKIVSGSSVLDPCCNLGRVKQFFQHNKETVLNSDCLLVLACGNGVQSVIDGTRQKLTFAALDTLFLGEIERVGHFSQKCVLCADCIINETGGICPLAICSKGLLNGPCGGSKNLKCEVDRNRDCGWGLIYKRLKETGKLDKMKLIRPPMDNSKRIKPQNLAL